MYQGCVFPKGKDVYLCGLEWVDLQGVRYEREETSEGWGEWKIVGNAQPGTSDTGTPHDPVERLEDLTQFYNLEEAKPETIDGVEYRRFWAPYNLGKRMLESLESGEWEPPATGSREELIESLRRQAETETGAVKLWAREDDSTVWRIITERNSLDVNTSEQFRPFHIVKSYTVMEYSRYNEPVAIKPPI